MQDNVTVATRFKYTGAAKGGAIERRATALCNAGIEWGKQIEALLTDGANKTSIMTNLDSVISAVHTQAALQSDTHI